MQNPAFWAYAHAVLYATHGVLFELQNWGESCPCHSVDFRTKDGYSAGRPYFRRRHEWIGETSVSNSSCPMRGRRAPELAAGRYKAHLEALVHQCAGLLLTRCQNIPNRDFIIRDWEGARTALAEVIEMKFAHWNFLPYRFCALGCIDKAGAADDTARAALKACLEEYAAMGAEQRSNLWPLAAQVLDAASPLRAEVLAFTEGGSSLKSLPGLQRVAGIVLCIPVAERSIEAKHRLNKLSSSRAPRASGSFVNVHLKLPDIRRRLREEPALLDVISADLGYLRTSPDRFLQAFSLHAHPTIVREQVMRGQVKASTVTQVMYRLDSSTQQARHRTLAGARCPAPKEPPKPKLKDSPNHGARLLSVYAMQHFRKTCRKDVFYSIAAPRASVATLQSALAGTRSLHDPPLLELGDEEFTPPALLPLPPAGDGHPRRVHSEAVSEEVVASFEERMIQPQNHVIFKVVHKSPKSRHIVPPPNSNLSAGDMSVSTHDIAGYEAMEDGSVEVLVALTGVRVSDPPIAAEGDAHAQMDPASTRLLTRRHLEALPRLDQNLLAWEPEGGVFYAPWPWPPGLPQDMLGAAAEVFTDMVIADALPGSASSFITGPIEDDSPPELRVLEHLEEQGMVSRAEHQALHGAAVAWNFTGHGLNGVSAMEKLRRPAPALKRREGILDKDCVRV